MSQKKQNSKKSSVGSKQLLRKKEVSNKFIYEVSVYVLNKNGAECKGSKFYASEEPLEEKTICVDIDENKKAVKFIDLIAAPESYLISHNYTPCSNDNV